MGDFDDKQEKIEALCRHFSPLIGKELSAFETAQIKLNGEWDHWFDLPIRLYYGRDELVSIAWSHFERLFISNDKALNFLTDGFEVRWVSNTVEIVKPAITGVLKSVELGPGEISVDGQQIEIWTRLLLEQHNGWLEVFNGLDKNAFRFHRSKPTGKFVNCC